MSTFAKIDILEERLEKLEDRQLEVERLLRRNNLLVFGMPSTCLDYEPLVYVILNLLNYHLGLNIRESDINNVYPLTNKDRSETIIKVEFQSFLKKKLVVDNAYKLKKRNIYVADDLCPEDQHYRKFLVKEMNAARAKGMNAKIVGYRVVIVNDSPTASTSSSIPENGPQKNKPKKRVTFALDNPPQPKRLRY
ncbi:uncharacterized protein LOC126749053 [Anthonomus grandis grandis]|uniref:uncharacterized protein LOC126749053 n=1 Tax=Anthonomus grandis grandis TaxID=2921223 RepID=UPI0021656893|nr:uncharacterized protein LOC126749053 [Anthonomus grandis grandis]